MASDKLTASELREILDYDPETGFLTWRVNSGNRSAGSQAGGSALGYVAIGIKGCRYQAHRVAWTIYHGEWPQGEVDHTNRDKSDNRIANLRLSTRRENGANCSLSRRNTSGAKGVTWVAREGKWQAQIMVARKRSHLGYFDNVSDAARAYDIAAVKFFGEFASTNEAMSRDAR